MLLETLRSPLLYYFEHTKVSEASEGVYVVKQSGKADELKVDLSWAVDSILARATIQGAGSQKAVIQVKDRLTLGYRLIFHGSEVCLTTHLRQQFSILTVVFIG